MGSSQIRFRAWDGERLRKVNTIGWVDDDVDFVTTPRYSGPAEDFILMQYTGLKDKNGVAIFEGDIVILCWSDEVGESHWGKVTIKNPFEYTPEEARYFIYSDEIEVIGNIYENKDLI